MPEIGECHICEKTRKVDTCDGCGADVCSKCAFEWGEDGYVSCPPDKCIT